jgi:3'(2'), 5'-bisphosphate nucleotidase
MGHTFWGWVGGGAYCDGTRIELRPCIDLGRVTLIHSRSHKSRKLQEVVAKLDVKASMEAGSVGYKVGQILLGNAQLYVHPGVGTKWWDSVGPGAVVLAAGGDVRNSVGEPLRYADTWGHRAGLMFAVPRLADVVAAKLA